MQTYISRASGFLALLFWVLAAAGAVVNWAAHARAVGIEVLLLLAALGIMFTLMFWLYLLVRPVVAALSARERNDIYMEGVMETVRSLGRESDVTPIQRRHTNSHQQS